MEPIRVMKGLFIIAMEAKSDWLSETDRYDFVPFDYGPCSFAIYDDLREFEKAGLLVSVPVSGRNWERYEVTAQGRQTADTYKVNLAPELLSYISTVRKWVTSQSFASLLKSVYSRYPDYASKSVFRY